MSKPITSSEAALPQISPRRRTAGLFDLRKPVPAVAAIVLLILMLGAIFAPILAPHDPLKVVPMQRLLPASSEFILGTDALGRDIFSRLIYGGRVSLIVGFAVALVSMTVGLTIGLVAGFYRIADTIIMRAMDGLMSIPNILLAVAIVALAGPSIPTVLFAIIVPEIPRVVRLTRSVVLSAREEPYVEAAIAAGTSTFKIMIRHIAPNTFGPLIVQGTYICAAAILIEAALSFLGTGINPETPSWGNMMAEGRIHFQLKPSMIFWPGLALSVTILAVNLLGDYARKALDPRMQSLGDRR